MKLPRPGRAPRRIPLWAWYLLAWQQGGRRAPRPPSAPKRVPLWFWTWKLYRLALAKGAGSLAWKRYLEAIGAQPDPTHRSAVVHWANWGITHQPDIHYTQDTRRDDYLHGSRGHLPLWTDCSGFVTYCYWAAGLPDPSGLGYRWLGYTGTLLENAARHGRILTNVSQARPGDPIVIGPGTGWHVVLVLEAGPDPLVVSHGSEAGPKIQRLSVDPRQPKRVCQTLP